MMLNSTDQRSFDALSDDNSEEKGAGRAGHHVKNIRTLALAHSHAQEHAPAPIELRRSKSNTTTTVKSIQGKKKIQKSHSKGFVEENVPFFGNHKIASVLVKLAQARLLVGEQDPAQHIYHTRALTDALEVILRWALIGYGKSFLL
jgi:hypothetical protein